MIFNTLKTNREFGDIPSISTTAISGFSPVSSANMRNVGNRTFTIRDVDKNMIKNKLSYLPNGRYEIRGIFGTTEASNIRMFRSVLLTVTAQIIDGNVDITIPNTVTLYAAFTSSPYTIQYPTFLISEIHKLTDSI